MDFGSEITFSSWLDALDLLSSHPRVGRWGREKALGTRMAFKPGF